MQPLPHTLPLTHPKSNLNVEKLKGNFRLQVHLVHLNKWNCLFHSEICLRIQELKNHLIFIFFFHFLLNYRFCHKMFRGKWIF